MFWCLLYLTYRRILIPQQFHHKTASTQYNEIEVIQHYLNFKGVKDLAVEFSKDSILPFKNYHKNVITIGRYPLPDKTNTMTGLKLDFLLGRVFLAYQQYSKKSDYYWYSFLLYTLPVILFYVYLIILGCDIGINIAVIFKPSLKDINHSFYVVMEYRIVTIILLINWGLYWIVIFISGSFKQKLEYDYTHDVLQYVKKYYWDIYNDFVIARKHSSRINMVYRLGIEWAFKRNYRYLGPFGAI